MSAHDTSASHRRTTHVVAIILMACTLLLAGCFGRNGEVKVQTVTLETSPPTTVHLLTQTTDNGDDDALLAGTLVLTGTCLQVTYPPFESAYTIVWPEGTRVALRDGQVTVLKPGGDEFGRVGEQVQIGGGEWGGDLPKRCGGFLWGSDGDF